ncbi:MAG: hypothetical protein CFH30_00855 [Alphaproteobacteria bacterium MarineAlpha8_Bin1]|nr:MAG: hypothetical protein CFH30_00855 [Alphaproteobacteria bacterium MarineAlpha8_Bin1]|tara:strand:- start:2649 stop:3446 length:798 start_codon:yes stop_codon:yes gene_type:complete
MKKINIIVLLFSLIYSKNILADDHLPSYQSVYDITLGKSKINPQLGKTYVTNASGELFVDWLNNCNSWISNQRMVTRFINSSGVGTLSEINYSLVESISGNSLKFSLEVKENAELVERTFGEAKKDANEVKISFELPQKDPIALPNDVIFPHQFLVDVLKNMINGEQMLVKKVYEGTIPDKFFNISVFFTSETFEEENKALPQFVDKKFFKIRLAYYQDKTPTPMLEITQHVNKEGIASYYKFDYPEYSLEMNLKKLNFVEIPCD